MEHAQNFDKQNLDKLIVARLHREEKVSFDESLPICQFSTVKLLCYVRYMAASLPVTCSYIIWIYLSN